MTQNGWLSHVVFWTAIMGAVALGWHLHTAAVDVRESTLRVREAYGLLLALSEIEANLGQAESAQRGFLASREADFLVARDAEIHALQASAARVKELDFHDAAQAAKAGELEARLARRVQFMRESADAVKNLPAVPEDVFEMAQHLSAAVYDLIADMTNDAQTFLQAHAVAESRRYRDAMALIIAILLTALLVLFPGYIALILQARARRRAELALNEAKEAAETAARAKSTFLAVMSHEIRTPLNGVLGMLELLSFTNLNDEQRNILNVVCESGRALQRIIDDILDFSRIEAGRLEVSAEPCSLREVVAATRSIYAGNASSKGLLLTTSVDPQLSPAHVVDPLRLQQILNNLVSNAIKFTVSGIVEIRAERLGRTEQSETIRFSVRDTGVGMSPEVQSKLFQPFVQGRADTARQYGGSGLGLAICRRLAELMGGSMEVESQPGKGTSVHVTLSLPTIDAAALGNQSAEARVPEAEIALSARSAPSIEDAEREGTLILVADDHPTNRMLLCRQIETLGYAAETAENGAEALRKWRSGRFAAVLTDCHMPGMDGYEFTRQVRASEQQAGRKRIPVIACTANALRGEAEICFAAGMDDYISKPVRIADLWQKLQHWVPLPSNRIEESGPASSRAGDTLPHDSSGPPRASVGELPDDVMAQFIAESTAGAAHLKEALDRPDLAAAARWAHRIKGASRMVGATKLAAVCERLEQASRVGDLQASEREMDNVHLQIAALAARRAARMV